MSCYYSEEQVKILTDALEKIRDWDGQTALDRPRMVASQTLAEFRKEPVREARSWRVVTNNNGWWRVVGFPDGFKPKNFGPITVIELPTEEVTEKERPG